MFSVPVRAATRAAIVLCALFYTGLASAHASTPPVVQAKKSERVADVAKRKLDRSGKKRRGKASYYARRFSGRTMADGTPMDPRSNAAASKTLPLGTTANVTNLDTGRSAVVEIRDRGPYVEDRTLDVTPRTARELGMTEDGVARVEVAPIEVPQGDGAVKPGDGANQHALGR